MNEVDSKTNIPKENSLDGNTGSQTIQEMLPTDVELNKIATSRKGFLGLFYKIAPAEGPRFWRMGIMFLLISYIYSILRIVKDAVITEKQLPISILFIKSFAITPITFLCVFIIQSLLKKSTVSRIFKGTIIIYAIYFLSYTVIIHFQDNLNLSQFYVVDLIGTGTLLLKKLETLQAILLSINCWPSTVLYVTSELWGALILSYLFMTYANQICTYNQSRRFVPLFYVLSNIGLILSASSAMFFSLLLRKINIIHHDYLYMGIQFLCFVVCVIIFLIQRNLENNVLPIKIFRKVDDDTGKKKVSKKKYGLGEGLVMAFNNRFMIWFISIVLAYNLSTNIIDTVFKATMKAHSNYSGKGAAATVIDAESINQMIIGSIVCVVLLTPLGGLISIFGWIVPALLPIIAGSSTSLIYFIIVTYNSGHEQKNVFDFIKDMARDGKYHIDKELFFGKIAVNSMKICKYAFFDICKEALVMKMEKDDRPTIKGLIDGVAGKLGKSMSTISIFVVTALFENVTDARHICFLLLVFIVSAVLIWLYSDIKLASVHKKACAGNFEYPLSHFDIKKKVK